MKKLIMLGILAGMLLTSLGGVLYPFTRMGGETVAMGMDMAMVRRAEATGMSIEGKEGEGFLLAPHRSSLL
jgi:hypothetical protein